MNETTDTTPSPEGVEKLKTLVELERLRTVLTNPSQGWRQGALWDDQDTPYSGQGPLCLAGGVTVATGYGYLTEGRELDARIDFHPVTVALDQTIATLYPDFGWSDNELARKAWAGLAPGDRIASWNDRRERTLREVLAVIDATIARVGAS